MRENNEMLIVCEIIKKFICERGQTGKWDKRAMEKGSGRVEQMWSEGHFNS